MNKTIANLDRPIMERCVLFTYSHSEITEGAAMALLGLDRIGFRVRWIQFLKANPEIATTTGNEGYLNSKV